MFDADEESERQKENTDTVNFSVMTKMKRNYGDGMAAKNDENVIDGEEDDEDDDAIYSIFTMALHAFCFSFDLIFDRFPHLNVHKYLYVAHHTEIVLHRKFFRDCCQCIECIRQ